MPVDHVKVGGAGGRVVLEIAQPVGRATPQWDEAAFRTEAAALAWEYNQEHGPLIDHVTFWTGVVPEFEVIR